MPIYDDIELAFVSLKRHPLRTLLTILGMIIGVGAVVAMVSIGLGARQEIEDEIRRLGTNLLIVFPVNRPTDKVRNAEVLANQLTELDGQALKNEVVDIHFSVPIVTGKTSVVLANKNWQTAVIGTSRDYLASRDWLTEAGRNFFDSEIKASEKVVLLGRSVVEKISPDQSPLGKIVRLDGVPFRVIGLLAEKGASSMGASQDDLVIIPISTLKSRLLGGFYRAHRQAIQYLLIKINNQADIEAVKLQIERILNQRHAIPTGGQPDFSVRDPVEGLSAQREASDAVTYLLASIAGISLLVGGISIMNIMLVNITERSREIGIRVAVGAQRVDILRQFLAEASMVAFVGGILGVIIGVVTAYLLQVWLGWNIQVSFIAIMGSLLFAIVVGLLSGIYPAYRASQLNPIDALRRD